MIGVAAAAIGVAWTAVALGVRQGQGPLALASRWVPLLSFLVLWALLWEWHADDAAISYAFANNIARGLGPVAHLGADPVEGFSNPAWTLLLAFSATLGVPPHWSAKVVAVAAGLGTLLLVRMAATDAGAGRSEADATVVATGTTLSFVVWTASGLETAVLALSLVALLVTATHRTHPLAVAAIAALVTVLRPEGAWLTAAAILMRPSLIPNTTLRSLIPLLLAALGVWLAWEAFRVLWFEDVLPNPFYAKTSLPLATRLVRGLRYLATNGFLSGAFLWLPGAFVGVWHPRLRALTRACGWLWLAGTVPIVIVGGDWMEQGRLLAHLVPIAALACVPALWSVVTGTWLRETHVALRIGAGAALALSALLQMVQASDAFVTPTLPMAVVDRRGDVIEALGGARCGRGARVATPDVGALLYRHPELQVVDLGALTDRAAALHAGDPTYWPKRLKADPAELVLLHGPWVAWTGLDDDTLSGLGYEQVCAPADVPGSDLPHALWVHAGCSRDVDAAAQAVLDRWCRQD